MQIEHLCIKDSIKLLKANVSYDQQIRCEQLFTLKEPSKIAADDTFTFSHYLFFEEIRLDVTAEDSDHISNLIFSAKPIKRYSKLSFAALVVDDLRVKKILFQKEL